MYESKAELTIELFEHGALCSGTYCDAKKDCARYVGNIKTEIYPYLYVIMITRRPPLLCPFFMAKFEMDPKYLKNNDTD